MGCPFGAQGDAAKGKPDGERKSFYRLAVFPHREIAGRVPADLFPQGGYATAKAFSRRAFPASRWAGSATGYRDPAAYSSRWQ